MKLTPLSIAAGLASTVSSQRSCTSSTFQNITLYGGQITAIEAQSITNFSSANTLNANFYPINVTNLSVCQVVLSYTHPGLNDLINVTQWLPAQWNGRFMGIGGGGFATGQGALTLVVSAAKGYSSASTDGGHFPQALNGTWALASPGNINWNLVQDFASVALDDMATLGKAVTAAYYGTPANYSYWNGCSTGGRQGHMMAQRYPRQFDGIIATAPAINWDRFLVAEYWGPEFMNTIKAYPRNCELQAITTAAIAACDALDGVADGVVSLPDQCKFDAMAVVNQTINCTETGGQLRISPGAARVANAFWRGANSSDGTQLWYGFSKSADMTALANTTCSANGTCVARPWEIPSDWLRIFLLRNASFDLSTITPSQYDTLYRQSQSIYKSILGTSDPDLTDFKARGGRMIVFHGLDDQLIMPNGTYDYYNRVLQLDPKAGDYYRFFPAPGIAHCFGGPGWFPGDIVQATVDWVEKGIVPDTLAATSVFNPITANRTVNLCAYPKVLTYTSGDANVASSYTCQ